MHSGDGVRALSCDHRHGVMTAVAALLAVHVAVVFDPKNVGHLAVVDLNLRFGFWIKALSVQSDHC